MDEWMESSDDSSEEEEEKNEEEKQDKKKKTKKGKFKQIYIEIYFIAFFWVKSLGQFYLNVLGCLIS